MICDESIVATGSLDPEIPYLQSKGAKIRNRYNQVPHLTQDTNGKVTVALSRLDYLDSSELISPKFIVWSWSI